MEAMFHDIGGWLEGAGAWAYVVAPLVMASVALLPIPAEAPALINGVIFGPVVGTAITWTGAMLGAALSFEIARAAGRPAAVRWLRPDALERADRVVARAGWRGLLLARFVPLIAFTALNWGAGLTPIGRWTFLWTTAVGILPGAILFTATGWSLGGLMGRLPWIVLVLAVLLAAWAAWRYRRPPTPPPGPAARSDPPV